MKTFTITIICFIVIDFGFAQMKQAIVPNIIEDKCLPIFRFLVR